MNYFGGLPPPELQVSLNDIFMHYSRKQEAALERGCELMYIINTARFMEPKVARELQHIAEEIIDDIETSKAELMLLYFSRSAYGIPDRLAAPMTMFKLR